MLLTPDPWPLEAIQASSSIGRAAVSKTAGWGFDSLLACHLLNMNDEAKQTSAAPAASDTAQLVAAIVLAIGGVVAFYVLKSRPEVWASWVGLFGGLVLGVLVFAFSQYGRNFWQFVLESRVELRKVFWPSRNETFMTTLVVLGFVLIASVFFWLLDLTLASLTKFFTGQSG